MNDDQKQDTKQSVLTAAKNSTATMLKEDNGKISSMRIMVIIGLLVVFASLGYTVYQGWDTMPIIPEGWLYLTLILIGGKTGQKYVEQKFK